MKTLKLTTLLLLLIIFFNCGGNDDNNNTSKTEIIGQWRLTSGSIFNGADKYAYFNDDNTLDVLRETNDNFKGNFNTTFTINNSEITVNNVIQGLSRTYNYILEDDILVLTNEFTSVTLQRVESGAPSLSAWIQELTILDAGNVPWNHDVDMAFNFEKTQILYGNIDDNYIALIDPTTFDEVGQITTTHRAFAVEVEKLDLPDKYIFQSDDSSSVFYGYFENSNELELTSQNIGSGIMGLASIDRSNIWVASSDASGLFSYNYETTNTINTSVSIEVQPYGLDYQDGFLYVSDGIFLHKCQTIPGFEVIETYSIPDFRITGVAFDGINFWVNGYSNTEDVYKIIKTSLAL